MCQCTNTHNQAYLRAVKDAMTSGTGLAHGIAGGLMRITALDDGFFLEFSRPQSGWSANSLRLHVRHPIGDLLLGGGRLPRQADRGLAGDGQPEPGRVTAG
jgi:hypothetical protein